eukprot:gnl/TRDRNA2_/TRDRNA2_40627_c0_seq1.p1 gnl/TRDRNA2_/TRDRNA2_40627_c0~~gnl/TRDRNA2_/TRDRNA2_40627_c0_seq1.p1  ORF type:complete len:271 (-),score=54.33 gnl/TRDRNA2_/TRDRNA2_40627_c0_seq1:44-856(-)
MVLIRGATVEDMRAMQMCNLICLPENYAINYWIYHAVMWPSLPFVAEDGGMVVGYVLAKMEEDNELQGHITSLAVLPSHRKMGLAAKLMNAALRAMEEVYHAEHAFLNVRVSNQVARHLYTEKLGFELFQVQKGYYADGEDGYNMRVVLGAGKGKAAGSADESGAKSSLEEHKEDSLAASPLGGAAAGVVQERQAVASANQSAPAKLTALVSATSLSEYFIFNICLLTFFTVAMISLKRARLLHKPIQRCSRTLHGERPVQYYRQPLMQM